MPRTIADILIPVALDVAYSYALPPDMEVRAGDVVRVPFGPRDAFGVVWSLREEGSDPSGRVLKSVLEKTTLPALPEQLRRFIDWVSWYTLAPKGQVLAMALKTPEEGRAEAVRVGVRLGGPLPERMTPARRRVIEAAGGGLVYLKRDLADRAAVSVAVIDGLIDAGTLEAVPLALALALEFPVPDPEFSASSLSPDQANVAAVLRAAVRGEGRAVTLVDGVTGSGKTEVYFEAVAEALTRRRQVLILMPEIALTAQFLERFAARFGTAPQTWHSGITGRRRERLYAGIASGEAKVVAGARSALFLPYADLGLIIVDEEHEAAYKQEDGVSYHARDMAVARGRIESCAVVLASATPSVESLVNVERGKYCGVHLPERFGGRVLPRIEAVDLKRYAPPKGRWISPLLEERARQVLERGEQVLFFLNRRGYSPLTLCRACGHRHECPNCSAWLVEHRFRRTLVCHHCGHIERMPMNCVACGSVDSMVPCGPGVERIAEETADLFPDHRRIVLSSDMPGGAERFRRELEAVATGAFPIVIGTQLVAKGHNFPSLTLVGVVDADIGLTSGDPRAAERTFQLLQQVTGRAGRGDKPGEAMVQTWQPEHPVLKALLSGDRERFYAEEIRVREIAGLPPFGRLAGIIVSARDKAIAESHARILARAACPPDGVSVLGPAEAPMAQIRGKYRFRLLVKADRRADLQGFLRLWLRDAPKLSGGVRVAVDVDPYSFL